MSSSAESSDKSLLLSAFNTQFFDFVEDIQYVFSDDTSIKKAKTALYMIKKFIALYSEIFCIILKEM